MVIPIYVAQKLLNKVNSWMNWILFKNLIFYFIVMFHEINSLNLKLVFDLDLYLRSNFYFSRMMNILSVKNAFKKKSRSRSKSGMNMVQK